jgi:lipopolysaccharide transport system permease protein
MHKYAFLYWQWLRRDVAGRYRGSVLGLLWPVLQPAIQIGVFTLIFYDFMRMRWPGAGGNSDALDYALNVFAGLAVFNFFAEVLGRSPVAVLSQPNLVTKVRFPLPLLPAVTVGGALVHVLVGSVSLLLISLLFRQVHPQALWLPLLLLPLILYGLALAWVLAGLGVYLRDIGQVMPSITSLLMFLTPIFYPTSAVPQSLKALFALNPIAWGADTLRAVLLLGLAPDWNVFALHLVLSSASALLAWWLFLSVQQGFADVL